MYLVTGATGQLGRRIVEQLRSRDLPVRAFVRLTSSYRDLEDRGAEIFIGDLRQPREIAAACQGVKYLISTHGTNESRSSGTPQEIDYRANIDLIEQGRAAGIEHFTFISVLGAERGYEESPVFKAKRAVEKFLQTSGLNYTILRPSGFASNLIPAAERFHQTGVYVLVGDPRNRTSIISTDDLAQIAVEASRRQAATNQILPVGGPEILQRGEIPQILGRILNRDPIILNLPLLAVDGVRNLTGWFSPETKAALGTLSVLLANEFYCTPAEIEQLQSLFNIQLERLEDFFRRYLRV